MRRFGATCYTPTVINMAENFPPLSNNGNRPVVWEFALDQVIGESATTNAVTIYLEPNKDYDESGRHPGKEFSSVTITRAELREMLNCLDEDIKQMQTHCPNEEFV